MSTKLFVLPAAVLGLGLSGCGGSSPSSHAAAVKPVIYRVTLSGASGSPAGAASATGAAVVAFHGTGTVCWRFAHLHGFSNATGAQLQLGQSGHGAAVVTLLSVGRTLHHKGCRRIAAPAVKTVEANPSAYFVSVTSTSYPNGAVRGQL